MEEKKKLKICKFCNSEIVRWKNGEFFDGLSGWICECGANHTIDQYPYDLQTIEIRQIIIESKDILRPERLTEGDWVKLEEEYKYVI